MASSTASVLFSSLSLPKASPFIPISSPAPAFLYLSGSSLRLRAKPAVNLTASFRGSRLVTSVAVSSEFEQDEEVGEIEEEPNFSPDLKLFVGNLPFNVDSADLAGLFEQAGNVEMVEVIYDKMTGRSRGFGFVTMSTIEEVQAAAQQFNGYEFAGRPLRVNSGPPPPKREESGFRGGRSESGYGGGRDESGYRGGRSSQSFDSGSRLYVGNLSWAVDNSSLENLFSEQGKVVEARVVYDRESGRSRGFGFVTYSSAEEANNAIESLDGVDLSGRSIRVTIAESKPRRF
uniref:RRM domain-containing protein n=1 Tax=Kalanchoe fedtschenkoi TaxID=63787 RepID=A0A7N0RHE6_KALFE